MSMFLQCFLSLFPILVIFPFFVTRFLVNNVLLSYCYNPLLLLSYCYFVYLMRFTFNKLYLMSFSWSSHSRYLIIYVSNEDYIK